MQEKLLFSRSEKKNNRPKIHLHEDNEYLIELRNVVKKYEGGAGSFTALKGASLFIKRAEFVAVVGKSGSGKSTLLNMITGIDRPTSGEIVINRTPIHKLSEGKMAVWRGNNLGIVFQFFQLLPTLTAYENVILPMDFCKKYSLSERKERALHLLEEVDLVDQASKLPSALSGGQQQRVAIARALANDPPIVVADEPTGNLDTSTAEAIFRLFQRLVDQGKTILTVTHDQDLAGQVTRTIFISDGNIHQDIRNGSFQLDTQVVQALGLDQVDLKNSHGYSMTPDLVQSLADNPSAADSSRNAITNEQSEIQRRIKVIFSDRSNSVKLLQEEFRLASDDSEKMQILYDSVVSEARFLATQAEYEGKPGEARRVWKVVMDATKPLVKGVPVK
jgi:putative ABC transport system ATP-binding protein